MIVYNHNILESVIVKIIPRNAIIIRGASKDNNHISRDDLLTITLSRIHWVGSSKDSTMRIDYEWMKNTIHRRVVFANSFSAQTDHGRSLNKW